MGNFKEDVAKVRAIVLDVDGVMTTGEIIVTPDGDFMRKYNVKDGFAMAAAIKKGYHLAVITGGKGNCLNIRCKMLGIEHLYLDTFEKLEALKDFMQKTGMKAEEILYMGDDIPDVAPMMYVGLPVCPSDAASEVLNISRYVSQFKGGEGCVRDIVEQVMRARGDWFTVGEHVDTPSR